MGIKFLLCDDSKLVRIKLKKMLERVEPGGNSPEFLEAEDGQQGVELYKEHGPDLVFLDIVMPEKSGVEVVKEIMEFDPEATIIMASSVGTKENLKQALEFGAKDFIQKPLNSDKVKNVVQRIFSE